jgi:hypothetical protein
VNEDGKADISPWWSVTFFEGTLEQQNERLKELRQDPKFAVPFNKGEVPVYFEGGATCDDSYARIHKQIHSRKS